MDKLENLQSIIDEELSTIHVTKRLQNKTLKHIFKKRNRFWLAVKKDGMRMATLFSVFVVMLTLGINFMTGKTKVKSQTIPQITTCTPKNNVEQLSNQYFIKQAKPDDDSCTIPKT